jgi:penicillin-binding protein 1A
MPRPVFPPPNAQPARRRPVRRGASPKAAAPRPATPRAAARGAAASTAQPDAAAPRARRKLAYRILRWSLIAAVWGALAVGAALIWFARDLPRPEVALDSARRPGLALQDRTGRTFATFGDVVGEPLRLSDMPPWLPQAAVAVEDRRFWTNWGIDPIGILRATWANLRAGRLRQGGSTITQQVAKNLFLSDVRTLKRKVQELMLTAWLTRTFTKKQILEIWMNRIYLGSGAWGMDAAARIYFGVPARKLNLWQCAVLAGLPKAPSRLNPRTDPEAAAARARVVLQAMVGTGALTQARADQAAAAIHFTPRLASSSWFADWAAQQAEGLVPEGADAVLRTTLDARVQRVAEERLAAILAGPGARAHVSQGAVVVLDAASGTVLAMVGGGDAQAGGYNRAVLAHRQPGSAFKPFVWLNALDHGLTPDSTILDAPLTIGDWSPHNMERGYRGEVTLTEALAQSLNTAAVRLLQETGGPAAAAGVARRLGIADQLPGDLSLALGTGEVSVLEMAAAYAAFFNGGYRVHPTAILSGTADRERLTIPRAAPERAMEPDEARAMVRMLGAVVASGTGRAAAVPGRFVAGKTGTTQDSHDAWFVGAVGPAANQGPTEIIAVWLGNDDAAPMHDVLGGGLPARVFHDIAARLP